MDQWLMAIPAIADSLFTTDRVCYEKLEICTDKKIQVLDEKKFVKRVLDSKPHYIQNDDYINNIYAQIAKSKGRRKTINSLYFTDVHLDLEYTVGAPTECDWVICCRNMPGEKARKGDKGAGPWGSHSCDLPQRTFKSMLEYIKSEQPNLKAKFMVWGGDNSSHNVWNITPEDIWKSTQNITDTIMEVLSDAKPQLEFLPAVGNHDNFAPNQ